MKVNSKKLVVSVGLLLAAFSAEAQFGDFLKVVSRPSANDQQESAKSRAPEKENVADNACPKCGGKGSVSRGLKVKKCKTCGGTGIIQKKSDAAPADATAGVDDLGKTGGVQKGGVAAGAEDVVIFDDITVDDLKVFLVENKRCLLLDVREPNEFAAGHIEGAVNIPVGQVSRRIGSVCPDKARDIYVYCQSGKRSRMAAQQLTDMDYTMVHNVLRGLNAWRGRLVR